MKFGKPYYLVKELIVVSRRHFLKTFALTGTGAVLAGCSQRVDSDALVFRGWPYEPDLVLQNVTRFERDYHADVNYAAVAGEYRNKMAAMFIAGTPVDCCYVRDDDFAGWVQAGWLRPIHDLTGALDYRATIFPFNWEAMTYDEKLYGLPYYTDFTIWVYNERLLGEAGFDRCGETLDEITEQAIRIKGGKFRSLDGRTIEYPIAFPFKQTAVSFNDWWALNYASEVDLFSNDLEPTFPDDTGHRAERVMQWLVDRIHKHHIIHPESISIDGNQLRDNYMGTGQQAFCSINKYDLERLNNRKDSAIAHDDLKRRGSPDEQLHSKICKMALYPSLEKGQRGTLGWTRMYSLTAACRPEQVEHAWQLIQFLGGKDREGNYGTAKWWFRERGLGFGHIPLLDDADVIAQTTKWGDIDLIREQIKSVKARECIKAPWYPEFETFHQAEIQRILLKEISPRDGLARIAKHATKLRQEWAT